MLYLHGRPASHIMHERLARQVAGHFCPVDPVIRWHDKKIFKPFLPFVWVINALYIVVTKRQRVILVSGLHITATFIRIFSFGRKKIIAHLGDQNLYFLYSGWFKPRARKMQLFVLRKFNAIICEGKMGQELLQALLKEKTPLNYASYLGVPEERQKALEKINPDLTAHHLLVIAAGWEGWRYWYKGLDLMLDAFDQAAENDPKLTFTIIGFWPDSVKEMLLKNIKNKNRVTFAGKTQGIESYLEKTGLYFHCSRGDAFPTSVLEAMTAGLPVLTSKWTGSKEYILPAAPEFVCEIDKDQISIKLQWYLALSHDEKKKYSSIFRNAASTYTEKNALQNYIVIFNNVLTDLRLVK